MFKEKDEDAEEGCREVDEEVLGLGIPSTRAAATEPPIWRILYFKFCQLSIGKVVFLYQ